MSLVVLNLTIGLQLGNGMIAHVDAEAIAHVRISIFVLYDKSTSCIALHQTAIPNTGVATLVVMTPFCSVLDMKHSTIPGLAPLSPQSLDELQFIEGHTMRGVIILMHFHESLSRAR
ncbi:hypothetical protein BDR03DRAFT_982558 [Suillus americanus]|nr:hypothetical protein BDR03DRAFT_982558 [Suillus americanus]